MNHAPLLASALSLLIGFLSADANAQYNAETRTLSVDGNTRSFLLARPASMPPGALPLVISLHGDGGNSAGMRSALPLETAATQASGKAVFVYPKSKDGAFEYWSSAGRAHEGQFVQQIIAALHAELGIDKTRVYLVSFSGGATMANALGCRLGRSVIRGLGIHSGTLYPVDGDFGYTGNGGVDCALPPAILVWGKNDNTGGVSYADGQAVLENYKATHSCSNTSTAFSPSPCVAFNGCTRRVNWCAVDGLGHAIWGGGTAAAQSAATAIWNFIAGDAPAQAQPLFGDGFEGGTSASNRWVMGYYVGYESSLQTPAQIDFSGLTHLMIGRLIPNADATLSTHFDIDAVNGPIWAQQAVNAAHAASRKAVLMVGGAGEIDGWRSAATPAQRAMFVTNLLAVVDQFGADGLDIDWEPIETQDHANLLALAQALRSARPGLVLTLPVEWINTNLEWNPRPAGEAAFLQAIAPSLDRINVMTYDMAAAYEGWNSWFSSPFNGHTASTPSSVSSSMQYYLDAGIPAARLGMGFGFFGNCFRGVEWPRMAVTGTNLIASDGAMSYRNILASYRPQMTLEYDPVSAVFLHSPAQVGPMGCNLVTYEDPLVSTPVKAGNARDSGYGAAILWTISQGYLPSEPAGQRDPLLTAIKQSYLQ